MQRLKEETAQAHKETEQYSYGMEIMTGRLTSDQYAEVLIKNYQLHAAYEPALQAIEGLDELFCGDLSSRMREASLVEDIQKVNAFPQKFEGEIVTPTTIAQALGCMYVLEGSTLGGAVILKKLRTIESINSQDAFSFYGFYGKNLGKKWQEFGGILTNFAGNANLENQIVQFAISTFDSAKRIFSRTFETVNP